MSEPLPDEGWSREIVTIKNAIICPVTQAVQRPAMGVYSEEGGDCLHASLWRGGTRMTLGGSPDVKPVMRLPGRHMWGGLFYGHFGHFIVETMSRCWAFKREKYDSIIFVPKHAGLNKFKVAYRQDYWDLLGLDAEVTLAPEPIEVEELIVPGQGFGLGKIAKGTPEYQQTMHELTDRIETDPPRKIYISRAKFSGRGGVIAEQAIEENMVRNGYTPLYPEKIPLVDQLRYYKSATHIVGIDSSAFHIAGMTADPSKKFAFILRRENNAHEWIALQLEGMTGRQPVVINALTAHWMDKEHRHTNHHSWGELDHEILAQQLAENGFIDSAAGWIAPTEDAVQASIDYAIDRDRGNGLERRLSKRVQAL